MANGGNGVILNLEMLKDSQMIQIFHFYNLIVIKNESLQLF